MLHRVPGGMLQSCLLAAEMPAACHCVLKRELPPLVFKHTQTVCTEACSPLAAGPLQAEQLAHPGADGGTPDPAPNRICYGKPCSTVCAASLQCQEQGFRAPL